MFMLARSLIVALFLAPLSANAQTDPRALRVHVRSEKAEYRLADDIKLEVRIQNVTDEPVKLFGEIRWGFVGGTQVHVRDSSGEEVPASFLDHDMLMPGEGEEPSKYISLAPGHFLGTFRTQRLSELVAGPGLYRVIIEYSPPLGAKEAGRPGIASPWSVFSKAVTVKVVP